MKNIYRIEQDGVVGVIECPDHLDPDRPLAEQLQIRIGFDNRAPRIDADDFAPRAQLVMLALLNYLRDELGIDK